MADPDVDMEYYLAAVSELKPYLLSDQLFWPLGARPKSGGIAFPSLTLGGMLLARARLAPSMPADRPGRLARVDRELETIKQRWGSAWGRKAAWEFSSRLNQWKNYLEEYRRNPEAHGGFYPHEVSIRAILELLTAEIQPPDPGELGTLNALDRLLKIHFAGGGFIWDPALQEAFLPDRYWFLYGSLEE